MVAQGKIAYLSLPFCALMRRRRPREETRRRRGWCDAAAPQRRRDGAAGGATPPPLSRDATAPRVVVVVGRDVPVVVLTSRIGRTPPYSRCTFSCTRDRFHTRGSRCTRNHPCGRPCTYLSSRTRQNSTSARIRSQPRCVCPMSSRCPASMTVRRLPRVLNQCLAWLPKPSRQAFNTTRTLAITCLAGGARKQTSPADPPSGEADPKIPEPAGRALTKHKLPTPLRARSAPPRATPCGTRGPASGRGP